jgi:hypothetical protein
MKKRILIISLIALSFLAIACTPQELQCEQDSDCVAAACCHASSAVNKEFAPNCAGILCSASCEPGTLDCSQGKVACVKNECQVVLNE